MEANHWGRAQRPYRTAFLGESAACYMAEKGDSSPDIAEIAAFPRPLADPWPQTEITIPAGVSDLLPRSQGPFFDYIIFVDRDVPLNSGSLPTGWEEHRHPTAHDRLVRSELGGGTAR